MTLTLDRPLDLASDIVDDTTSREIIASGLAAGALSPPAAALSITPGRHQMCITALTHRIVALRRT